MRRVLGALALGLGGVAVLVALGAWQLQRLGWKQAVLAEIDSRIAADPVDLPQTPDPDRDTYRAVTVSGVILAPELRVLVSRKNIGAGYRIITAFQTATGRRVLLDRGFVPDASKTAPRPGGPAAITGNLAWPDEIDSYTPAPDPAKNLWFARDIPAMAQALDTEPLLIVARSPTGDGVDPMPVGTEGIPNDHLHYAITWFLLALVWAGMTVLLLWRISRRTP